MEKKMKASLQFLLAIMLVMLLFCMAKVSCADPEAKIHNYVTGSEVVKGPTKKLLPFVDCGAKCEARCSAHSRKKICIRACGTCCSRCKCVPPGTYGNREVCGRCYTDMVTHGNKPKCP
ncbi:gibberellin-regulated protein 2 [Arachis duranensis]|uniref:Gibberellin-regulated protein 2 n=1 Tax=Arachis duranensis TaxID=130453 RepID=A0A6P4CVN2_ARADU|nr:gibberellin-regulated protein 2 [Arachis duranensis]